jgi:hypothetical protein
MSTKKKIITILGGIALIYGFVFFYSLFMIDDLNPEALSEREQLFQTQKQEIEQLYMARVPEKVNFNQFQKELEELRNKKQYE